MKNEPLCHAPCPIARSLGRIGDSWSIMILRDAFAGFTRFDEFQKSSNVAPNILSRRLKALVDDGLLEKVCYSSTPPRYEYHLTRAAAIFAWCCWRWRNGVTATSPRRPSDAAGGNRHPAPRGASHGG
jgi:DNA-binding HxlR family transcriptional regulator